MAMYSFLKGTSTHILHLCICNKTIECKNNIVKVWNGHLLFFYALTFSVKPISSVTITNLTNI